MRAIILERESEADWVREIGGRAMNWGSAEEFFAMGGYGVYVWGSYGVTAVAIAAELWFLTCGGELCCCAWVVVAAVGLAPVARCKNAFKVLDAPGLRDDFYLNLLDWGNNNVIAVALGKSVFLWSASTGNVEELLTLPETQTVTSVGWADRSTNQLAVGVNNGTVQIWDCAKTKQFISSSY